MSEYTKCPNCGKSCLISEIIKETDSGKFKCIHCIGQFQSLKLPLS